MIDIVAPALALVGSVGMSADDRAEWMLAAGAALSYLPEDLLRQGVKAAMRKADHPSKIVAAIIAEVDDQYAARKRSRDSENERIALVDGTMAMLEDYSNRKPTHEEVDAIMAEHGIPSSYAKAERVGRGPPQNPTVRDYVEIFGLSQEAAEAAVKTLLPAPRPRADTAKPIGNSLPPHAEAAE